MSDRLIRKLDVPTQEDAAESAAEVFATRYSGG
jgi:hypothetical protein